MSVSSIINFAETLPDMCVCGMMGMMEEGATVTRVGDNCVMSLNQCQKHPGNEVSLYKLHARTNSVVEIW